MQDKKKKSKKQSPKMDYFRNRKPDSADTAYREAVSRLRVLLAESYSPLPPTKLRDYLDSAGEDTDNQSVVSGRSTKFPSRYQYNTYKWPKTYYPPLKQTFNLIADNNEKSPPSATKNSESSVPPELMSFIERQEDYIEQLEKESRFCREELSTILSKVKEVISENENLHERQKNTLIKSVFQHLDTETETETDFDVSTNKKSARPQLEGPAIVFESRISELEAQLTQSRIDLRKAQEQLEQKAKFNECDLLNLEHYKKQVEVLLREKDILHDTVLKMQSALAKVHEKENEANDQAKRSLEFGEQAQYEKNAAEMEIRRLKEDLDRQHAKLRDALSDQTRRISEERSAAERRYTLQIEQLSAELGVQWEQTNKLQMELDKQRRETSDLRRENAQKKALLDELKKDTQNKIISLQSDIGVSGAEKGALEQQIASLQLSNERNERQNKQEINRLEAEMVSLRQRLDRADADLIHTRRENIRLNEQIASLEKEINIGKAVSDEKRQIALPIGVVPIPSPTKPREELVALVENVEAKHAATVADLEEKIHTQNQLMDKLSAECHTLTQKLEDSSLKHKEEIRDLQTNLDLLNHSFKETQKSSQNITEDNYNSPGYSMNKNNDNINQLNRTNNRVSSVHNSPANLAMSRQGSQENQNALYTNQEYQLEPQPEHQYGASNPPYTGEEENLQQQHQSEYEAQLQYDQQYGPDAAQNSSEYSGGEQYNQNYVDNHYVDGNYHNQVGNENQQQQHYEQDQQHLYEPQQQNDQISTEE